jgi:hypothetical protein
MMRSRISPDDGVVYAQQTASTGMVDASCSCLPGWESSKDAHNQTKKTESSHRPFWLRDVPGPDLSTSHNKVRDLRRLNNKQQLKQETWKIFDALLKRKETISKEIEYEEGTSKGLDCHDAAAKKKMLKERLDNDREFQISKERLFSILKKDEKEIAIKPGPVGEIPMHTCFLQGLGEDIGKDMVKEFYSPASSAYSLEPNINTQYRSDLEHWKSCGMLDEQDPNDDGGLYTGETCLHIAIVKVGCNMYITDAHTYIRTYIRTYTRSQNMVCRV